MKKLISLLLAVVLAATCLFPAGAASNGCDCGKTPIVIVEGMNAVPLYLNYGTPEQKKAFTPETEDIMAAVGDIALPLAKVAVDRDWDSFCDSLIPAVNNVFENAKCNPDGTSKYDIYSETFNYSAACGDIPGGSLKDAAVEEVGADHVYTFVFDWRLDPMEHAKDLNDFIDMVLDETQHSSVSIIAISMGGVVTSAYLEQYGCREIESLVMSSSAFCGVELLGDIFNGRFDIDMQGLIRLICEFIQDDSTAAFTKQALTAFNKAGAFDGLQDFLDEFAVNCKDRAIEEALIPIFAYFPGIWGLLPEKDFESAKALLLDETEDAELIEKIDNYHYNVRINIEGLFFVCMRLGMKFSAVSNYNLQGAPVGAGNAMQNDTVIDTVYTSAGATCALLDETLGEGYVQAFDCGHGHNHLSADGIIDASTCYWPEQTWFIKNMTHVGQTSYGNVTDLYMWLVTSDTQCNVFEKSEFPQFSVFDDDTGNLSPVTAD